MSPFESLTTKVLPSRIWTAPLLIVSSSHDPRSGAAFGSAAAREEAAGSAPTAAVAFDAHRPAQHRRHCIRLAARDAVEQRLLRRNDAVCPQILTRDREVPIDNGDEPAIRLLPVSEVEPKRARRVLEQRFVPARGERLEELRVRIGRYSLPSHHPEHAPARMLCATWFRVLGARGRSSIRRSMRDRGDGAGP